MSAHLRQYLYEAYKCPRNFYLPKKHLKTPPLQIDDQDDNDSIEQFCNIFCSVGKKSSFSIELKGRFPITQEIADLAEIYDGFVDPAAGKVMVHLTLDQVEVLRDLSDKLRKTSFMGDLVNNPGWLAVSARTISSLYRFIRIIKEYKKSMIFG
ncbi:MAG: hypothetical protein JW768_12510 [Chitinispirillaceae bacterium]|nr:hypothetical protein [Chitinispirillaceae bacterium]